MAQLLRCPGASSKSASISTPSVGRTDLGSVSERSIPVRIKAPAGRNPSICGQGTRCRVVAALGPRPDSRDRRSSMVAGATAWGPLAPLVELFGKKGGAGSDEDRAALKEELLAAIEPLERGVSASESQKQEVEELASRLEALNPTAAPLKSPLINGQWKLLYTTSASILGANNPIPFLRPWGPIFQCIDTESLQARNLQTWPFFNQVQATLTPVSKSRVDVRFTEFKILSLIPVKAPQRDGPSAYLDTTYLDEDLRISRGNLGNLFVLVMDDSSYRIEGTEDA